LLKVNLFISGFFAIFLILWNFFYSSFFSSVLRFKTYVLLSIELKATYNRQITASVNIFFLIDSFIFSCTSISLVSINCLYRVVLYSEEAFHVVHCKHPFTSGWINGRRQWNFALYSFRYYNLLSERLD